MRYLWGLGFVLVIAIGFWIGTRGGSEVQGGESAGFLAAPDQKAAAPAADLPVPPKVPVAVTPKLAPIASTPPPAPVPSAHPEETAIAAAVLHRPWKEVSVLVDQSSLPDARKSLYAAVSAAVAGDFERAKRFSQRLEGSADIDARERSLLASALGSSPVAAVPASAATDSIAATAIALTLRARDAARLLASGQSAEAARAYSDVLLADATATWPSDRTALQRWTDGIDLAQTGYRWSAKGPWPSISETVKAGDSLTAIRQRVLKANSQLLICTGLIERVNQMASSKSIHPGDVLRIPTDRPHMLVDISTRWVLYMMGDEVVAAWEGGVGKPGNETQPGQYTIGVKQPNPPWFRPGGAPVPFGNPENPLGTRWLSWRLNGVESHLGFHGTTDPSSVGGAVSSGCIRLRNEDVEELFEILPERADVLVQP